MSILKSGTIKMDGVLSAFMKHEDFPVDIKDCKGKYTENNQLASVVSGLKPEDRIGMDIYDIARINNIPADVVEKLVKADRRVLLKNSPTSLLHVFLDKATNFIAVDKVVKQPVVDSQDKTMGILSYAKNILPYINRLDLYSLYKDYYPSEKAIQYFLRYLNASAFFMEVPKDIELIILLHQPFEIVQLAERLQLSSDDIRSYQASLNDKLIMIDYKELVDRLKGPSRAVYSSGYINGHFVTCKTFR